MSGIGESNKELGNAINSISSLITIASDTEEGRTAAKNIGSSAVTITAAVNNLLLPIAVVNFAFERARDYFNEKFENDLRKKLKDVNPESLVEPNPQIASKVLNGLAFSHNEKPLRDLYLNLLSGAMQADNAQEAHPAFAEIISQLRPDEAKLLATFFTNGAAFPIVQFRSQELTGGSFSVLCEHIMNLQAEDGTGPDEVASLPVMIENWIRLGLVFVDYSTILAEKDAYKWAESRPEYLRLLNQDAEGKEIIIKKGLIEATAFGKEFGKQVILSPSS